MPRFNDLELWDAIRLGDEKAFEELFDRYGPRLYKTVNSYIRDREVCEEVVHDVFLNIWNRRHTLEIRTIEHFLLTAVRYQVYNRMRAAKLSIAYTAEYLEFTETSLNSAEGKIREEEFLIELQQHIEKLPKRCQEIFYLSRRDHYSNQEIANLLGISKRTVDNQIALALKYIKLHFKSLAFIVLPTFISFLAK